MLRILNGEVVIAGAARTPIAGLDGALAKYKAPQLGGIAIKAALERSGVNPRDVDEVILGNVVSAGTGQSPAKQAAVAAGLPHSIMSMTVNTVCSAGMAAVIEGVRAILSGTSKVLAVGGMESRSNAPYLLGPTDKKGSRVEGEVRGYVFTPAFPGPDAPVDDYKKFIRNLRMAGFKEANTFEALVCPFKDATSMKDYAVKYAEKRGWTADFINGFAAESYAKAERARDEGLFADEIVPVGDVKDDAIHPKELQEHLRAKSDSVCSSYNAPSLGDGAAALVIAEAERARDLGLTPLARILGFSRVDVPPEDFIASPATAANMLIEGIAQSGGPSKFDILEGNESFGLQIPLFREAVPIEKLNVHGGAVALRHPLGAAGARILVTLIHAMKRYGLENGVAAICFASGGAYAIALELAD